MGCCDAFIHAGKNAGFAMIRAFAAGRRDKRAPTPRDLFERQKRRRRIWPCGDTAVGEISVPDDLRLLLDAIVVERFSGLQIIGIAAKWVPQQQEIERPAALRLPYVRHLVNEKSLPRQHLP